MRKIIIIISLVIVVLSATAGIIFWQTIHEKGITKNSYPAGNLKIDMLDVNSAFVKNDKAGKLFAITGKIKNGYSDDRSYIRVTGKLYTKGKILVQDETVFCGNVLSDIELSNLKLSAIKRRLSNRLGDNKSNMRIKPGQELPFVIVFSNLPENIDEFAIEVEGSSPSSNNNNNDIELPKKTLYDISANVPERPLRYVVDLAGIVDDATENRLNGYLQELEQKTTAQMVVLTILSLEGESIEDFSLAIANDKWKLGQKGKDNGVLFLISVKDRKYRIEVGYGLETVLSESLLGRLGHNLLIPSFRKGEYSKGIFDTTVAIADEIVRTR